MALAETAHLVTQLDLRDGLSSGLARAQSAVSGFDRSTNASLRRVGKGVGQVGQGIARIGMIAGTVAVGGIALATKAASDFGGQMNVINTIAQQSESGLARIGEGIKDFSSKTGAGLDDLTTGYYDLLSAGVKVKDSQKELELAWKLGRGALASTAEAVDFLTTAQNSYGLKASQLTRVSDQFAQAVADGKVKLSDIAGTFADVAPIAAQAGIGLNEIAAAYGFLTSKGQTAGSVTTQMSRAIIELAKPHGPLSELEDRTHKSYIAIASREGLVPALQQMREDAAKAHIPFIQLFGRVEAYKFALSTTGKNLRDFNREQRSIDAAQGTTDRQAEQRNKGLQFQLERLRATAKVAFIDLGEGLAPSIGRVADRLSGFIRSNRDEIKQLGKDIGGFIEGIPWESVLNGAKAFVGLMKGAWEIIKLIPPEITTLGAGLIGLNKLSGGLLGTGVGNIVGGLGGAVTKGVLSKVPGVGAFVATPVYVTNWPMGGIGGAGGAAGGAAGGIGGLGILGLLARGAGPAALLQLAADEFHRKQDQAAWFRQMADQYSLSMEERTRLAADATQATLDRILGERTGTPARMGRGSSMDPVENQMLKIRGQQESSARDIRQAIYEQMRKVGSSFSDAATVVGDRIVAAGGKIGAAFDRASHSGEKIEKAIGHLQQVDEHRGNRVFGPAMDKAAQLIRRATQATGDKQTRLTTHAIDFLRRQQVRAFEMGHTKLGRNLGHDITVLQHTLGRKTDRGTEATQQVAEKLPTKVNITVPVTTSVSVRDVTATVNTTRRYGVQAV